VCAGLPTELWSSGETERASDPSDEIDERSPNKKEAKFDGIENPTLKHLPPPPKKKLGGGGKKVVRGSKGPTDREKSTRINF
jgi:hypothetical protein